MKAAGNWVDPFDDMSDEEFDAHLDELFSARPGSVAVSLRVPPDLLGRVKRQAARAGVPYQTFMKSILETAVSRLERRRESRASVRRASRRG
jgi:predicted DNA binding CopG/RHH family protein